jgi:hypothetical protein
VHLPLREQLHGLVQVSWLLIGLLYEIPVNEQLKTMELTGQINIFTAIDTRRFVSHQGLGWKTIRVLTQTIINHVTISNCYKEKKTFNVLT